MLDDPGVDGDDNKLHEELLGAEPSGMEANNTSLGTVLNAPTT